MIVMSSVALLPMWVVSPVPELELTEFDVRARVPSTLTTVPTPWMKVAVPFPPAVPCTMAPDWMVKVPPAAPAVPMDKLPLVVWMVTLLPMAADFPLATTRGAELVTDWGVAAEMVYPELLKTMPVADSEVPREMA